MQPENVLREFNRVKARRQLSLFLRLVLNRLHARWPREFVRQRHPEARCQQGGEAFAPWLMPLRQAPDLGLSLVPEVMTLTCPWRVVLVPHFAKKLARRVRWPSSCSVAANAAVGLN